MITGLIRLKDELIEEMLPFSKIIILAGTKSPLSVNEVTLLRAFIEHGGSVLVLAEANAPVHMYNALTQQFGITVYQDCVLRAVYHKYSHPKECFIQNAMICPILLETNLNNYNNGENSSSSSAFDQNLNILYPYGCSLDVFKPALPLIASGSTSYPVGRPLGAFYYAPVTKGKLIVFGSGNAFTDK